MKTIFYRVLFSLVCALTLTVASCSDDDDNATPLSAPGDIRYSDITDNSFKVTWEANPNASGYIVKIKDEWKELEGKTQTVSEASASFTGLDPEKKYWVAVCATTVNSSQTSPFSNWTAVKMQEGSIAKTFASGEGLQNYPFIIKTPGQLKLMAYLVNKTNEAKENNVQPSAIMSDVDIEMDPTIDYTKAYYELGADIDMSGINDWVPIGTGADNENIGMPDKNMFSGQLDGKGHTISNFNINYTSNNTSAMCGLIGLSGAGCKVSNLNIKGTITAIHTGETGPNANYLLTGGIIAHANRATISNCSFEGSIHASFTIDEIGTAMVGGICGSLLGTISECTVKIPASAQFTGIAQSPQVGTIVGYGNNGTIAYCTAIIDGDLLAETKHFNEDSENESTSAIAGGICASAGGTSVGSCNVTVNGSLMAKSKKNRIEGANRTTAYAGGIAGVYAADMLGNCNINIKGSLIAEADNMANVGGAIGNQTRAGYGCSALHATITGEIKATASLSSGSTDASYAGGLYGMGSFQMGGIQDCDVILSGKIIAEHPQMAMTGGIAGSIMGLTRCWTLINKEGLILALGGTNGATAGGVAANLLTGNAYGSYAICKGTIQAQSETAGRNPISVGGVLGAAQGSRIGRKIVTGCYSLIEGKLVATGDATLIGGVVGMSSAYTTMNATYWWSTSDEIEGHTGAGASTIYQMPDSSKGSLEEAAGYMNDALGTQYGYYFYREKEDCLNITPYI